MDRKIYKDEDTKTIYEYIKKKDAEAEEWLEFSSAFKRKMIDMHNYEEELKWLRQQVREYKQKERENLSCISEFRLE